MKSSSGILLIDKNEGITSRDVVNDVVKMLGTKKVGHTGTLDPLATGVLVICVNKATKLVEELMSTTKEYIAEFVFGTLTDTLDITGNIIRNENCIKSKEEIEEAITKLIGTYEQTTPIYSAVKVNGKRLYEYARNGETVELPKRTVTIHSMKLIDYKIENNKTIIKINTTVSKGTYIRAIANDLANILGTVGIMSSLRRTKQGDFCIEDCIKIENVNTNNIIPIKEVLKGYKQVNLSKEDYNKIKNGQIIDNIYNTSKVVFIYDNEVIAIYQKYDKNENKLKPYKIF